MINESEMSLGSHKDVHFLRSVGKVDECESGKSRRATGDEGTVCLVAFQEPGLVMKKK